MPTEPPLDSPDFRAHAATILRAALQGVDPSLLVSQALADEPELDHWIHGMAGEGRVVAAESHPHAGGTAGRTVLVSVGKAALGMARGALHVLGDSLDAGIVLAPRDTVDRRPGWLLPQIELRTGGHPIPDGDGVAAAGAVAELVEGLGPRDRLLVLISGGGSALLTLPRPGLALEALQETTAVLLRAGVDIREMNRVRSALEELKAGGLSRKAGGASVIGMVLSDVVGDDPAVVASGPLTGDGVPARDVEILLRRRGLWEEIPREVRDLIAELRASQEARGVDATGQASERPSVPTVRVVGRGATALNAAAEAARRLGYEVRTLTTTLEGEARAAGRGMARAGMAVQDGVAGIPMPACLLASGETTVEVLGSGSGGRNQEVALGAALALQGRPGILVASLGTDGVDGPTDAAGAMADGETVDRARALGLDVAEALRQNDAYPLLDALGDLIRTGPTGTNVADLILVLVSDGRTAPPC